jgi:hypothetical protein
MAKHQQPNWQPVSALPMIAGLIEGTLQATKEQYETLLAAKDKPWVLDDALVARVIRVYQTQREDLWVDEEQLRRWQQESLTQAQQERIDRLTSQLTQLKDVTEAILTLADELKQNTIDQILARDDAELALDILTGKLKLPK